MRLHHANIVVADIARSVAFYVGVLGMRQTFDIVLEGAWIDTVVGLPGARARCVFVQPDGGGARLELLQYASPEGQPLDGASVPNAHGLRHIALEVDDLDAVVERLRAGGTPLFSEPVTVPFQLVGGIRKRLLYTLDPDGVIVEFCVHERVEAD